MQEHLVILRIIGGIFGFAILIWTFARFRARLIRRHEFFLMSAFGIAVIVISAFPDSFNIIAGMLSLQDKQFGRLIALLIISNFLLWIIIFELRSKDEKRAVQFDRLIRKLAQDRFLLSEGLGMIKEITVIIPALNEADNLNQILPRMPNRLEDHKIGVLVVDDGSIDNTVEVVKRNGFPAVSNPINRGGGAALRLGYDIAIVAGAKIIVTMDGDGQHMPEEIGRLVEPILRDKADFVIGSRVLGIREKDSAFRWIGIHVFSALINMLSGVHITDCSNGFRAFRADALQRVLLLQDQFHAAEFIIDAAQKKLRIIEVPITVLRRYSGESKKGKNLRYGINFAKSIIKTWLR